MGEFLFLGTGASLGVPIVGCNCKVCKSTDKKNKRLRPSALLKVKNKTFLIDAGPDFRQQALLHDIDDFDGLLLSHLHYDHSSGIDDMRFLYFKDREPIPCLLSLSALEEFKSRYYYLFSPISKVTTVCEMFEFHILEENRGNINFQGVDISYFSYMQNKTSVLGFRINNFAYVTDIREYEDTVFEDLKGVDKLVISALRKDPSIYHFSIDESIDFAKKVKAKSTWLTHLTHEIDYNELSNSLPFNFYLAYDGLEISF